MKNNLLNNQRNMIENEINNRENKTKFFYKWLSKEIFIIMLWIFCFFLYL